MINNFIPNTTNYMQSLQAIKDNADRQMRELQSQQNYYQPPQVTQNFQLAPMNNQNELEGKFVSDIKEVEDTFVIKTGVFLTSDLSMLWVKDSSGKIRTFNTNEVIELDEKDKEILALKDEIAKLKGDNNGEQYTNEYVVKSTTKKKSTKLSNGNTDDE